MGLLGGLAVGLSSIVVVVFADQLIELWMGRSFPDQRLIVSLVAGLFVMMAITSPYNMILNSMGETRAQIVAWSIFLLVTVVTKLALVEASSLWVVPLVTLAAYAVIVSPSMILISIRHLDRAKDRTVVREEVVEDVRFRGTPKCTSSLPDTSTIRHRPLMPCACAD